jgi:hypothetical protein
LLSSHTKTRDQITCGHMYKSREPPTVSRYICISKEYYGAEKVTTFQFNTFQFHQNRLKINEMPLELSSPLESPIKARWSTSHMIVITPTYRSVSKLGGVKSPPPKQYLRAVKSDWSEATAQAGSLEEPQERAGKLDART